MHELRSLASSTYSVKLLETFILMIFSYIMCIIKYYVYYNIQIRQKCHSRLFSNLFSQ